MTDQLTNQHDQEKEELEGTQFIAQEFLEQGLCIDATDDNLTLFMSYLRKFEDDIRSNKGYQTTFFRPH